MSDLECRWEEARLPRTLEKPPGFPGTSPVLRTVPNGGFVADDLGFLGPGILDLVTELCPPQDTG